MELDFINWILRFIPKSPSSIIGNGDDAALMEVRGMVSLVATDMLLDGVHFLSHEIIPELIGRKAVAVNFSDIAAMGGVPTGVFVSLAIPKNIDTSSIKRLIMGAQELAAEFGCGIDGGDTNSWHGALAVNISVTGKPHWRGPVTRGGAQDGDAIILTGSQLGGSLASGRHATFTPRLKEVEWILDRFPINSMIDLSDGLATDANHLAHASRKKIILQSEAITNFAPGTPEFNSVFCEGEDFELLFTCSQAVAAELLTSFPWSCGLRNIGEVTSGTGVFLRRGDNSTLTKVEFSGYQH